VAPAGERPSAGGPAAALSSGGLDSAVILAELARRQDAVFPLYVRCGLFWEDREVEALRRFIAALGDDRIRAVEEIRLPMDEVYGEAWYASGRGIPGWADPDEAWEIPGRNILLLAKAAVWAKVRAVPRIAIGTLGTNPFPDATPRFFSRMEQVLAEGLAAPLEILRPLAGLRKAEVIRRGRGLPLELTLSCARPEGSLHCGACGKCKERIEAFREAGIADPTPYAAPTPSAGPRCHAPEKRAGIP
jgi:7-cyano-7-deazaguanine synthase